MLEVGHGRLDDGRTTMRPEKKFLSHHQIPDSFVTKTLAKVTKKLSGEVAAIDIGRLSVDWEGFYRIRIGKKRIISPIDVDDQKIFVEVIDFRGSAYKR